jgi:hypothetical protein
MGHKILDWFHFIFCCFATKLMLLILVWYWPLKMACTGSIL